jgi:hypothetical protein
MDYKAYDRIFQKRKVIDEFYKCRKEDDRAEMSDSDSYDDIPDILSKYRNHGLEEKFCFSSVYTYSDLHNGSSQTLHVKSTCVKVKPLKLSRSEISFPQKKSRLNWTRLFEKSKCKPIPECEGGEHENIFATSQNQPCFRKVQSEPDVTKQRSQTSDNVYCRLGCRRLALDNPCKLPLTQERRERLEQELEDRKKNLKRRISQRVLSVIIAEAEVDLI